MAAPKTQVNSATGIMGVTGSGKSSLAATLAKYVWRRWKKVTLYSNSDGGGFPAEVQACVALGIMRVFRMHTRDTPDGDLSFETCQRVCQGWWPRRINPATGEVPPGVEMVPPIVLRWEQYCKNGHLVKVVPGESLLRQATICPTCKVAVTTSDMQIRKTVTPNKGFEDVGAVFFDGLTSMLAWQLRDMGHRAGRLELRGEESSIGGKVQSGELKFGGSTRSHVGFVQARGEELVHLTLGIPNLVVPPVFTMLTHEDVDDRSLSILGPKISGRAKTDEAPQWFGNMLETAKIPSTRGPGEQRILYLSEFTDDRGVRHLCKHRGSPGTMPAYLIDPPEGETDPQFAFTEFNLGRFFELLDVALEKRIVDVRAEFPDAPGVPEGMVEIGDSSIQPGLPPAVGATDTAQPAQPAQPVQTTSGTNAPPAPKPRARKVSAPVTSPAAPPPATEAPAVTSPAAPQDVPLPLTEAPQVVTPAVSAPAGAPAINPVPQARTVAPPSGARPGTPAGVPLNAQARPTTIAPRPPAAAPRPPASAPIRSVSSPVPPSTIGDVPQ